ncbi:hypothetical protein ACFXCZ_35400 [Streptomyces sp. NPDC059396]|uniref:hypothetical protein n=1 Tax=Streptomyces sp. NPDC059396 TaxID=3346819 RepID=UPI003698353A
MTSATSLLRWEIHRRPPGSTDWREGASGAVGDGVGELPLARAVLAAHLMTVDRYRDLDDYRVVVRHSQRPASAIATEDGLASYLGERGYYESGKRPPLRLVLDGAACDALPAHLQEELDREEPPGPR